jgi:ABC-type nickel/cobalt efflux system permease component RcnA
MTWKMALHRAVKKEMQPMRQATHWIIFISCATSFMFGTVHGAALASYEIIIQNPEIVSS